MWSIEGFEKRVRHVVLDEADMLFGDAYIKPVDDLLQVWVWVWVWLKVWVWVWVRVRVRVRVQV